VRGPDVRYWTRTDKSLQIWLREPCKETTVTLAGWLAFAKGAPKGKGGPLNLPLLQLPEAATSTTTVVRITAAPGLAVTAEKLEALTPVADKAAPGALTFATAQGKYAATFQVRPAVLTPEVEVLTSGEVAGGALAFVTTVDYHVPQGEVRTLTVRLRG